MTKVRCGISDDGSENVLELILPMHQFHIHLKAYGKSLIFIDPVHLL